MLSTSSRLAVVLLLVGWLLLIGLYVFGALAWHNPLMWGPALMFGGAAMLGGEAAISDAGSRGLGLLCLLAGLGSAMLYALIYFFVFGLV